MNSEQARRQTLRVIVFLQQTLHLQRIDSTVILLQVAQEAETAGFRWDWRQCSRLAN